MYCPLGKRYLQAVVVGVVIVRQPRDIAKIGELAYEWFSCHLKATIGAAAKRRGTVDAIVSRGSGDCRVSPPGSDRWLIQIDQSDQLRGVVTDVSDVHGQVVRDCALDTQTP